MAWYLTFADIILIEQTANDNILITHKTIWKQALECVILFTYVYEIENRF